MWFKTGADFSTIRRTLIGQIGYDFFIAMSRESYKGKLVFGITQCDSSSYLNVTTSNAYDDNQWHHLVGTYDLNAEDLTLYVDGQYASNDNTPSGTKCTASNPITIGDNWGSWTYWDGYIDDVRIYSRALSATEVKQLYNMGR